MHPVTRAVWLPAVLLVSVGAAVLLRVSSTRSEGAAAVGPDAVGREPPVGALGRIEPDGGVVRIGARSLTGQPSIVRTLLVEEGDSVRAGQVIGELDSTDQLRAGYRLGQARVGLARRRLEQVQAGAKRSDLAGQQAEIERVAVQLENARSELLRHRALHERELIPDALLEAAQLHAETLARSLRQAEERLASLTEVRPVDVELARAELAAAAREMERARAEYEASLIRSPLDGRVLTIHARPGEEVGPRGVMDLAKTEPMQVVAEVVESDIARVRRGQRARISGHGVPGPLFGTVEKVGLRVLQNTVLPLDPAAYSDARIIEVRIRLDDGAAVADLVHLRVDVVIEP